MNKTKLLKLWHTEEKKAQIHGWDFSHIRSRYEEEHDLPWDYFKIIKTHLTSEQNILDIDTGGGEFLLSLHHPYKYLSATEAYPPNIQVCKERLLPLGINFKEANALRCLPYCDQSFDMVINRHGSFYANEIGRVLKDDGLFITEQVGAENDRELVELLFSKALEIPFPEQYAAITKQKFEKANFTVIDIQEVFRPIKFYDVGALVWFAHIIEWEFPNFSVENNLKGLFHAQAILEKKGVIEGSIHRFLLIAKKNRANL